MANILYYKSGNIKSKCYYKNGKIEGEYIQYNVNDNILL